MARVPDAEIERLKREIALVRLVAAKGVKLAKRGDDLMGLCPFSTTTAPRASSSRATRTSGTASARARPAAA
jgi:hypothetical protein